MGHNDTGQRRRSLIYIGLLGLISTFLALTVSAQDAQALFFGIGTAAAGLYSMNAPTPKDYAISTAATAGLATITLLSMTLAVGVIDGDPAIVVAPSVLLVGLGLMGVASNRQVNVSSMLPDGDSGGT